MCYLDQQVLIFHLIGVHHIRSQGLPLKFFYKTNIDIFFVFFVIITILFIKQIMDGVNNSICDCITQLHNKADLHSIWKKNIIIKTSTVPIECLHQILRVAIAGILNQWSYLLKEQLLKNCWWVYQSLPLWCTSLHFFMLATLCVIKQVLSITV